MKKTILTLLLTFSSFVFAQEKPTIEFSSSAKLTINGQMVNNQTSIETIIQLLGTPQLVKEHKSGKKTYVYPELGLAVQTFNDKLLMIGANYNWDGDKNFPNKTFTGKFTVGKTVLDTNTTKDFINSNSFLKFENLFLDLYVAGATNAAVMVGFKDNKITQLGVEFKPN
jgi:hypothetical protein